LAWRRFSAGVSVDFEYGAPQRFAQPGRRLVGCLGQHPGLHSGGLLGGQGFGGLSDRARLVPIDAAIAKLLPGVVQPGGQRHRQFHSGPRGVFGDGKDGGDFEHSGIVQVGVGSEVWG
jgi:hypothetical protein